MALQMSAVMIGVEDLDRSKKFYAEGLGCTIQQDYPAFVSLGLGDGSSTLALYEREAAAQDAGVSAGLRVPEASPSTSSSTRDAVDEVIGQAVAAGGSVVREASAAQWGGYFGYFSDPDGYLWKVAANTT